MISVIIPTRNRAHHLGVALNSLAEQSLPADRFEVLVIDNGSSDNTADVTRQASSSMANIRYFVEPEAGLHAGRHRGLSEARSDVLVYADDDIRATPTWLEAITENFADPTVSMLGGNNYPDFQGTIPGWLTKLWNQPFMGGQKLGQLSILSLPQGRRHIDPNLVWGCNFSVRKQVVLDAGGFHPDSMPTELLHLRGDGETHISRFVLENRLGCIFDSRASVHHVVTKERMTFDYFRQRAFNQGVSDSFTWLRDPARHRSLTDHPGSLTRQLLAPARHLVRWTKERDRELRKLTTIYRRGHEEGFRYHQQAYRVDPDVRAWVHRQDYFGVK